MYGLRAYKGTLTPLKCQKIAFSLIGFPVGYLLATTEDPPFAGPEGYWVGICSGLIIPALMISRQLWLRGAKTGGPQQAF
jgi:Na+-driven multidrug efflux pump